MDNEKLKLRIGDVTQDAAEAKRIQDTVTVLDTVVTERLDEIKSGLPGVIEPTVESAVQRALAAERQAHLPPADPKRVEMDCKTDFLRFMREGRSPQDGMKELLEKYPQHFTVNDGRQITLDGLRHVQNEQHWWTEPGFRATMTTSSSSMSYVLPTPFANEVQLYAQEAMPVMAVLRELPVSSGITGYVPVATSDGCTAYITAQGSAPTDSTIVPGQFSYTLMKFAVGVPLSNTLWNLSVPAFQSFVVQDAAYAFGIKQHSQLATGTDSTQWCGLETIGATEVTTGSSLASDLITTLFLTLPQMHRARGVWTCNETTLASIWTMKDASGRREIPFDVEKMTLYGRPIYTNSAHSDTYLFFFDPSRYIRSSSDYKSATIGFGNGYTATSTDITYLYIGEMLDGGYSDSNAYRYSVIS